MASPLSPDNFLSIFTVDAFTNVPFAGNPAAVCLDSTEKGLSEKLMLQIAAEMNLAETAFLRSSNERGSFDKDSEFKLRWFTPTVEVPLCGHGTLASAATLFHCVGNQSENLSFETLSGTLRATKAGSKIELNFPLYTTSPIDQAHVKDLLKLIPAEVTAHSYTPGACGFLLIRLADSHTRQDLEQLKLAVDKFPEAFTSHTVGGVIVTLRGSKENGFVDSSGTPYDFGSRFFAPWVGLPEDPVCGSANTVLAGYWSEQLGKNEFYARQCSARGGDLWLRVKHDEKRVEIAGNATVVLEGKLHI